MTNRASWSSFKERIRGLRGCWAKMIADAVLIALAYAGAFVARLDGLVPPYDLTLWLTLPFVVPMKVAALHHAGAYRMIWRYCGMEDLRQLVRGIVLASFFVVGMGFLLPDALQIPRSVPFIDAALTVLLVGGVRALVRIYHERASARGSAVPLRKRVFGSPDRPARRRTLVVGAGDAGELVVREMLRSAHTDYDPVAFVDDDPSKLRQSIHGVPVLGAREDIPRLVERLGIEEILIAIPTLTGREVQRIVDLCQHTRAQLKILPARNGVNGNRVHVSDFRNVQIEDLLGREPIALDLSLISEHVRGRRVLVTGAGGSIGSELCRQLVRYRPLELQLLGRGEHSIYEIHRELSAGVGETRLVQIIGDVINKPKLERIFALYRPEIIFHAGADKHVPLMELNPDEAVLNNVLGTKHVLEMANAYGAERVVVISTDKAVNPTSVMGCCKRVAELLVQSGLYPHTKPIAVRFGNVLGSRGSVIPHFQRQIESGGPVTITHREIRRYFMTIPEAVGLVLQAGAMGKPGDLFVLDMGEPVRILDLATNMIRLAGLVVGKDIEIREIGLRPGEKLNEELYAASEQIEPTSHAKIRRVRGKTPNAVALLGAIERLRARALVMDCSGIREVLAEIVPEYEYGRYAKRSAATV